VTRSQLQQRRDRTPRPGLRFRVWQSPLRGSGRCVLTGWIDEISARRHAKLVGGTIETWDEYVAACERSRRAGREAKPR
jgi:hypothetical protein